MSLAKQKNKPDTEGVLISTSGKGGCQGHLCFSGNELSHPQTYALPGRYFSL